MSTGVGEPNFHERISFSDSSTFNRGILPPEKVSLHEIDSEYLLDAAPLQGVFSLDEMLSFLSSLGGVTAITVGLVAALGILIYEQNLQALRQLSADLFGLLNQDSYINVECRIPTTAVEAESISNAISDQLSRSKGGEIPTAAASAARRNFEDGLAIRISQMTVVASRMKSISSGLTRIFMPALLLALTTIVIQPFVKQIGEVPKFTVVAILIIWKLSLIVMVYKFAKKFLN